LSENDRSFVLYFLFIYLTDFNGGTGDAASIDDAAYTVFSSAMKA